MKKSSAIVALCCCIIAATFTACKKSEGNSRQHNQLLGKWRKTRVAVDSNGNGVIDNLELLSVTSYDSIHILLFKTDGSGVITNINTNTNEGAFVWSLENNNAALKIGYTLPTASSITQHIDSLSSDAMILRDNSGIVLAWNFYTKQ